MSDGDSETDGEKDSVAEGGDPPTESGGDRPALADERGVETVYQPAEDSHLLAETVVDHVDSGVSVLDVGTGSGYVARRIHEECDANVVGTDLNRDACLQAADAGIAVLLADLFGPIRANSFDVVCCNPPYLPTPPEQEWDDSMERALSGGEDGLAVIDPFLADLGRVLTDEGEAYLLISTLTGPGEVRDRARDAGLGIEQIAEQSHPYEKLLVFRLVRN